MDILFGSVTGTAENIARDAARVAKSRGHDVRLCELDEVTMEDLADMNDVLVVISTYGEGEMPFNAETFWDELEASEPVLKKVSYGVLALGDTAYEMFCQAGKDIDARFEELGATRRLARIDCDLNFEKDAAAWIDRAIPQKGDAAPRTGDAETMPVPATAAPSATDTKRPPQRWSRANPFPATIVDSRILSGDGSSKDMRHITLSIKDSGLAYEAGDSLAIVPTNNPDQVAALLERLGAAPDTLVEGFDLPLGPLLTSKFEINIPSERLVRAVGAAIKDEALKAACLGDKAGFDSYLWSKDVLDVLNVDPRLQVGADVLLSLLQPLQHRAYSIASSPKTHPDEIHLTVAAVRWDHNGRDHGGVCSTHLADRLPPGAQADMFMVPNKRFRVPADPDTPMIMVGPGTGIAPFIAFLQERQETGAIGDAWLFFGDRQRACDHVYEAELQAFQEAGVLTRLDLAFSRDQDEKIYVQDRMRAASKHVFAALEAGAYVYLCGDAKAMAPAVDQTLHDIVAKEGGLSPEGAITYITDMRRGGRYLKDVY
ncbi:MAG: flavodoxin domain-containing protein [Pseudomonadota bacterium]